MTAMENGNRKLPVIDIAGAEFYVDAVKSVLIDTKDRNNVIRPLDMLVLDTHIEMLFDKVTRNAKWNNWRDMDNERYEYVWLRHLEVYDTEGAKIRLGRESALIPKNLPVIDVEGVKFLCDGQHTRLLQQDNPYNQIHKNDMVSKEGIMGFYFDTQKNVVPFPHELESVKSNGQLPSHIRFVPASEINRKVTQAENNIDCELPKSKGPRLA